MITTFDIDEIMYRLLVDAGIGFAIEGGIYHQGGRPTDSDVEDIVINHISLTMDVIPQTAVTNVNIYVPDDKLNLGGRVMAMANENRLKQLSEIVMDAINRQPVKGVVFRIENMSVLEEPSIEQHYANIRVYWTIAIYQH